MNIIIVGNGGQYLTDFTADYLSFKWGMCNPIHLVKDSHIDRILMRLIELKINFSVFNQSGS